MQGNFDVLIEHMYFGNYLLDEYTEAYEEELRRTLDEFSDEVREHYVAHNRYHDWFVANMQWNRLMGQVALTLCPPSTAQRRKDEDALKQSVVLEFSGVLLCEMICNYNNKEGLCENAVNELSTIFMMGFSSVAGCDEDEEAHGHTYECIVRLFGAEKMKIIFSAATLHM